MKCYLDMDRLPSDGSDAWHGYDFSNIYGQNYYIEFDNKDNYWFSQQNKVDMRNRKVGDESYVIVSTGHYKKDGPRYFLTTSDGVEGRFFITKPLAADRELGESGECVLE